MVSFADFDIFCVKDFWNESTYDKQTHQYSSDHVNPQPWSVRLDAKRGLRASLPIIARERDREPRIPTTTDEFLDQMRTQPDLHPEAGGGGGPPARLPESFVAYDWTVVEEGGSFRFSERVALPVKPTELAWVELPRRGWYTVTCRVTFTDRPPEQTTVRYLLRDYLIASIGDSFASGEGNPDNRGDARWGQCDATTLAKLWDNVWMRRDPEWTEPKAARSRQSGPAFAARDLHRKSLRSDGAVVDDNITFVSFARSGAEIFDGLLGPQGGNSDFIGLGQTEEMKRTVDARAVDALLISIGGNDAGFAGTLTDLVTKDFSIVRVGEDGVDRATVIRRAEERLGVGLRPGDRGTIEVYLDALRSEIETLRQQIEIREVYINGYPTGLFENLDGQGQIVQDSCGIFEGPDLDITGADAREITRMGRLLNDLIRRKAGQFGWHFVDVDADFRGHGYCAPEAHRCWVQAEESCNRQGNFDGTMHPNARGHAIYGLRLAESLRRHTVTPPRITVRDVTRRPERPTDGGILDE